MSEICINDEILKCKYVNGPVKSDIALHKKKKNYNQNANEDWHNLSTTSMHNCQTSENNIIKTTYTPNNNDVIKMT